MGQRHPFYKGLFFVEGIVYGSDLTGVHTAPIHVADPMLENRLIYSAHSYGPEEYNSDLWNATDFPNNLKVGWDWLFGFIPKLTGWSSFYLNLFYNSPRALIFIERASMF